MDARHYLPARVHLGSLSRGDDLLGALEELCSGRKVACGVLTVIGSLSRARLAFYDQREKRYLSFPVEGPVEIAAGTGNVSLRGGKPFCHVHLVLSDAAGRSRGGHLVPGCEVFAAEVHLIELEGTPPDRQPDGLTGLNLWRFPPEAPPKGGA